MWMPVPKPPEITEFRQEGPSLADQGTRYEHLQQLLSMWREGHTLLQSRVTNLFNARLYAERIAKLWFAIEMLEKNIDMLSGYGEDNNYLLARKVNAVGNDSTQWTGGRGTRLKGR